MVEKREKAVNVKVTESEKDLINRAAALCGKRPSDFVREVVLEKARRDIKKFQKDLFI